MLRVSCAAVSLAAVGAQLGLRDSGLHEAGGDALCPGHDCSSLLQTAIQKVPGRLQPGQSAHEALVSTAVSLSSSASSKEDPADDEDPKKVQARGLVTNSIGMEADYFYRTRYWDASVVPPGWLHFVEFTLVLIAVKYLVLGLRWLAPPKQEAEGAKPAAAERPQVSLATLRDDWSGRSRAEPGPSMRLEECIATGPDDKLAIVTPSGRQVTYRELRLRSRRVAAGLRKLFKADTKACGLVAEKGDCGDEALYGIFGILTAGCAYVPMPSSFPPDRLAFIAEDAALGAVAAMSNLMDTWQAVGVTTVPVLDITKVAFDDTQDHGLDVSLTPRGVSPDDVAVMFYTSGSTGKPKGVSLTHRAEGSAAIYYGDAFVKEEDKVLAAVALNFDVSITDIFPTFLKNATLVMGPKENADVATMNSIFTQYSPSLAHFVPTVYSVYAGQHGMPASLERVLFVGEALDTQIWSSLWQAGKQVVNFYGPTECSVGATTLSYQLPSKECTSLPSVPIGTPFRWREAYVMSLQDAGPPTLLPHGEAGELWLAGPGLAVGYANLPEKTAAAFVQHPVDCTQRAYRTGDLCQWLDCGVIQYLGRIDTQVKLHGLRIELGEIEHVLRSAKSVVEAVVVVQSENQGGGPGRQRLFAWISPADADVADALAVCRQKLPAYMMPAAVRTLAEWPRNSAGKLDRLALAARAAEQPWGEDGNAAQETEAVEVLDSMSMVRRVTKSNLAITQHFQSILGFSLAMMVADHFTDAAFMEGGGGLEARDHKSLYQPLLYFCGFDMAGFVLVAGAMPTLALANGSNDSKRLTWSDAAYVLVYALWYFPVPEVLAAFLYLLSGGTNYYPWVLRFGHAGSVRWFALTLLGGRAYIVATQWLWPAVQYLIPLATSEALKLAYYHQELPTGGGRRPDDIAAHIANLVFATHWAVPMMKQIHSFRDSLNSKLARCLFHFAGMAGIVIVHEFVAIDVVSHFGVLAAPFVMACLVVAIPDCSLLAGLSKSTLSIFWGHRILYPVVVAAGIRLFGVLPVPGAYSATGQVLQRMGLDQADSLDSRRVATGCCVMLVYMAGFFAAATALQRWLAECGSLLLGLRAALPLSPCGSGPRWLDGLKR